MRTLIAWIGMVTFVLLGMVLEGGHVGSVIQGTASFMVFGPVFTYLFYSYGFVGIFNFWRRFFGSSLDEKDASIMERASSLGFLLGGLGAILGIIHVMENLADATKLGAGIALAFVSLIYGALPAILLMPFSPAKANKTETKKAMAYSAVAAAIVIACFMTVLYAQSNH